MVLTELKSMYKVTENVYLLSQIKNLPVSIYILIVLKIHCQKML